MKHSFILKTSELKSLFKEKLEFNSLSIDSDTDVYDSINTLLHFYRFRISFITIRMQL